MDETEIIYVTKYALTDGVRRYGADYIYDGMARASQPGSFDLYLHGEGKDWHRTFEAAQVRAEQMRQAKIASLKKQIAKLEKLAFKDPAS